MSKPTWTERKRQAEAFGRAVEARRNPKRMTVGELIAKLAKQPWDAVVELELFGFEGADFANIKAVYYSDGDERGERKACFESDGVTPADRVMLELS